MERESQMKVLVTGGLGYLGSVMVERLLSQDFEVRILDLLIYGNFLRQNDRNVELIKGDVKDSSLLRKAIEGVDSVIHLAGIIGESASNIDRELTINVNYLATKQLAQLCKKSRARLVFSSTCSVYGARPNEFITEKSEIGPLGLYAMSKLIAEESIMKYCDDYIIFRLGTLFGLSPRMRFDLVINRFIAQAIQEKKITVYGGHQRRPFVHIRDVSEIFVKALESNACGIYNVGGTNHEILGAAKIIEQKTGCHVSILSNLKDARDYAVDSALVKNALEFRNTKDIEIAVDEISEAYSRGVIKDYEEPVFSNEKWLKRL